MEKEMSALEVIGYIPRITNSKRNEISLDMLVKVDNNYYGDLKVTINNEAKVCKIESSLDTIDYMPENLINDIVNTAFINGIEYGTLKHGEYKVINCIIGYDMNDEIKSVSIALNTENGFNDVKFTKANNDGFHISTDWEELEKNRKLFDSILNDTLKFIAERAKKNRR